MLLNTTMRSRKKILIIGAGIGQINLVRLSKQMGHYTIVVSPKGNYPAIDLADELFDCDIYDRTQIVSFAQSRGIDAVVSDQNDLMMPTVAYVSEKLNIPGNSFAQVMSYCDKNCFRAICCAVGIPVPIHISVNHIEEPRLKAPLPWIVKPTDSQSNIGITKVSSLEDYPAALRLALSNSKIGKAIVEQFIEGKEFVCEGFVFQGKYYNLAFGERKYFNGTLLPCQTIFPASLDECIKQRIVQYEEKVAEYVNPNFGIIHSEYLYNKNKGEIIVIESAIRGGGVFISSHLIPMVTGVDINTLLLRCSLNEVDKEDVESALSHRSNRAAAYICFTLPIGIVNRIEGLEEIRKLDYVKMCDLSSVYVGMKTEPMRTKGMRKGPILVEAENREQLFERILKVQNTLNISVADNRNSNQHIIWD